MNTYTKKVLAIIACLSILAGCGVSTEVSNIDAATPDDAIEAVSIGDESDTPTSTIAGDTSATDAEAAASADNEEAHVGTYDYDDSDLVEIALGDTITASSGDVSIEGSTATITESGAYELSGTLTNGSIIIDADDAVVQLILNGADITNPDGAAIAVMDADSATVILAEGSSNSLTDGELYELAEGEDEPNATLFSKADLTVGGAGSLTIVAQYNDGIASKDGLVIDSGTITVDAVDDAIRGKDYVVIEGGTIDVTAGDDAIKSDEDEDLGRGYVTIVDGDITIAAGDDGIHAQTDVLIDGGQLTVASGDDAIHADLLVTINGGSILVTESFEGIEAEVITINDGFIDVTSSDDGLNVASADATTEAVGQALPEQDLAAPPLAADGAARPARGDGGRGAGAPGGGDEGVGEHYIHINGGTTLITVTGDLAEQGDGIDATGHIEMTGGLVVVSGPTDTRNSALDYSGGSFVMTGGTFVGTNIDGRNSEGIGAGSTQASLYVTLATIAEAGTVVHIESADGENLVTFEAENDYDVVVFSSPDLTAGESYDVYVGGTATDESVSGLYETYTAGSLAGTATAT